MIWETSNPELPRQTKCSTDLLVSIFKQTVEQNVPYATFFRSAMPVVNGAFSNSFVKQWAVQSTVQSVYESVPREPPVIVAKPHGEPNATVTYGMSKPMAFFRRRWTVSKRRSRDVAEDLFQPSRILIELCLRPFWVLELLVRVTRPGKSLEIF